MNTSTQQTTAASPLHDKIEDDIEYMNLTETEAKEYRDLVWHFINVNRWTFTTSCMAAMNQVILNSTKPTN